MLSIHAHLYPISYIHFDAIVRSRLEKAVTSIVVSRILQAVTFPQVCDTMQKFQSSAFLNTILLLFIHFLH